MRDTELFSQILGIVTPWTVTNVEFDRPGGEVRVTVACFNEEQFRCPECGNRTPGYDSRQRKWRHLDTCQYKTIVIAEVPRVKCSEHGIHQIKVPWSEANARLTALFEAHAIDVLLEVQSVRSASRMLRISWGAARGIMARATERGLNRRQSKAAEHLSIDEVSYNGGHNYLTIISNQQTGQVLDVRPDRRIDSLAGYYQEIGLEACNAIKTITMDMWAAYISATLAAIPGADKKICLDKFHVSQMFARTLNSIRSEEHRQLMAAGDMSLKGTKFLWLQNPENIDKERREQLTLLQKASLKTGRAWAIKEAAREIWDYVSLAWALKAWNWLIGWAFRSRIEKMRTLARQLREHLWGILNAIIHRKNNARAESINSRIQKIKSRACGFASRASMRDAILFHLGGLDLYPAALSNIATHTNQ